MKHPQSRRGRPARTATTLLEVLISAVILTLIVVPISLLLSQSTRAVQNTDLNREVRGLMDEVMQRVESTDLTKLWDSFGIDPKSPTRFDGKLVNLPGGSVTPEALADDAANPLHINQEIVERLGELGLSTDLKFRFMTRTELGVDPSNRLKSSSGIMHLQAGVVTLTFAGKVGKKTIDEELAKPIYCPMILGRPGLLLSQCPAVDPKLRDGRFKNFP
ncbi:MAG: hypothetical protein HY814_14495 [Candidatus Riflebacteria bacterium]|nr:hypothetical protein [Candidatus Riflebacteria bacterium]